MSKPATEARLAASALGFTEVIGRGHSHIITRNPINGKCAYDGQVGGGWHYGPNLDQETDTAWEADTDPNYYKMIKALYNVRSAKNLNYGDLLKWTDPTTGEYVTLQPADLSWVDNVTDNEQYITTAQNVQASVSDDVLLWTAGYGSGRHFRYQASPLRLTKNMIIDSSSNLPTPTVANPYLQLMFYMGLSSGISVIINGATWDKKTKTNTVSSIEFRTSSGVTLWSFSIPQAWDSGESQVAGTMQVKKSGSKLSISIRIPQSFFASATYPVFIDPTLDYQVSASANDSSGASNSWSKTNQYLLFGYMASYIRSVACLWSGVTIPAGATIDVAYISLYLVTGVEANPVIINFDDVANATAVTNYTTFAAKTRTTASLSWTPTANSGWNNTSSIVSIIQELVNSYSYASGANMQMLETGGNSGSYIYYCSYDYGSSYAPKLHIEYTEAAAAASLVIPSLSRTMKTLLVR